MIPNKGKKFATAITAALLLPIMAVPSSLAQQAARPAKAGASIIWFARVDPNENPWEKSVIASFEKLNPTIHVNLITAPNPNGQYDLKFNQLIQAGTPADVWSHLGQAGFADYYHRGLTANLDPLVKEVGYSFGNTPMNLVNTYRKPDGLFGIPSITLGSDLFYNKDIFDAYNKLHPTDKIAYPPVDWNDKTWTRSKMEDIAKKLTGLTIKTSSGTTTTYGYNESEWPPMFNSFQAGGNMFTPQSYVTGAPTAINLTDPKTVSFIQRIADYYNVSKISPPYSKIKQIGNTGADPFQYGNIAMESGCACSFKNLRTVKFHWGAGAVPWSAKNTDVLFTDPYMISKSSKFPKEAMEFVQYLTGKDSMTSYVQNVGFTPSNPAYLGLWYTTYAKITGMTVAQLTTLVSGSRKYGFESPNHLIDNFSQIVNGMQPYLDKINYGQGTAASVLPQAQTAINAIIAQNNGG